MTKRLSAAFLAASAALLALGGVMHTRAFGRAAVASSSLPAFYGNSFKALWLIDSATIVLAALFILVAVRPATASGKALVLLAVIPAATSGLLYTFIGAFLPAHILLTSAILTAAAGVLRAVEQRDAADEARDG